MTRLWSKRPFLNSSGVDVEPEARAAFESCVVRHLHRMTSACAWITSSLVLLHSRLLASGRLQHENCRRDNDQKVSG